MPDRENQFRIAAAQVSPFFLDREKTIEKAVGIISQSAGNGARLVVFPEAFISGYPDWVWLVPNSRSMELNELYSRLLDQGVSNGDPSIKKLCKAAGENNIYVVIGVNEVNAASSGSTIYNSLLFINENGEVDGMHRKLIPTGGERLIWGRGSGDSLRVYGSKAGKIGGLICWENYMPLARQALYEKGVQILTAPTWDKSDNWVISMRHIAREAGAFVVSCCQALKIDDIPGSYEFKGLYPAEKVWINKGNSCIVSPSGKIIAGPVSEKEEILYADIDLEEIISAKRMFDVAGHYSRPDVFGDSALSKKKF